MNKLTDSTYKFNYIHLTSSTKLFWYTETELAKLVMKCNSLCILNYQLRMDSCREGSKCYIYYITVISLRAIEVHRLKFFSCGVFFFSKVFSKKFEGSSAWGNELLSSAYLYERTRTVSQENLMDNMACFNVS